MILGQCPKCGEHTKLVRAIASDESSRTVCEDCKRNLLLGIAADIGVDFVRTIGEPIRKVCSAEYEAPRLEEGW